MVSSYQELFHLQRKHEKFPVMDHTIITVLNKHHIKSLFNTKRYKNKARNDNDDGSKTPKSADVSQIHQLLYSTQTLVFKSQNETRSQLALVEQHIPYVLKKGILGHTDIP